MSTDERSDVSGKRLVVFGAGYVGGEVARAGVMRGMRVTALTRNVEKARALGAVGVETVIADLAGDAWHTRIEGRVELAVNCVSSGGGGVEGYRRSYVDGMRSILGWARRSGGVGGLVYTGSTSVYPQSGGVAVGETASTEGAGETARVLLEAEEMLRVAPKSAVGRWFILRLAGIYGPGRHHLLDQLREGTTEFGGRAEHRLNLAHRDDIVSAIWAALDAPVAIRDEVFNVADDAPAPKGEVVAWLARSMGAAPPVFTGEPSTGRRAVTPDRAISNAKIKAVLGWRPRYADFRAGYASILEA